MSVYLSFYLLSETKPSVRISVLHVMSKCQESVIVMGIGSDIPTAHLKVKEILIILVTFSDPSGLTSTYNVGEPF